MMLSASIRLIGEKPILVKIDSLGMKSPQLKVDTIHSISIKKLLNLSRYEYDASKTKDAKIQSIIVLIMKIKDSSSFSITIPTRLIINKMTKFEQTSDIIIDITFLPLTIKCE